MQIWNKSSGPLSCCTSVNTWNAAALCWGISSLLGAGEGSLSTVSTESDDALANCRAQSVGEAVLCSVPTRGCVWHPFQEQGWDFEECVDRLLLQQTANQTASEGRLCVDCPVSAASFLFAEEISAI